MQPAVSYHDDLLRRLKDPKYAVGYLNACLEDEDEGAFLLAVRDVAQVHGGLRQLAKQAGVAMKQWLKETDIARGRPLR
jgi:DNA-binding phage protein